MYVAPLRCAVLYLAALEVRWDERSVSSLAHVERPLAKAYCTRLEHEDVLVHQDTYRKGWAFDAWASSAPRSRPGGNSVEYRAAHQQREQLYEQEQQRRRRIAAILQETMCACGMSVRQLAREAEVDPMTIIRMRRGDLSPKEETLSKLEQALWSQWRN